MGLRLCVFVLLVLSVTSQAQQAKPIVFREEIFDFGNVTEAGGPVIHEFAFTNNSNRPVKILSVQASCGCTTPGWTKEVIAPNKTGFVKASFNPAGRPGYFNKTLTVTTDFDSNPIILQIKGQVEVMGKQIDTEYPVAAGSLKLRTRVFNMGKVLIRDEPTVKEFPFINGGEKPVTFGTTPPTAPPYIHVEVIPAVVAPGAKAVVRISYDGKLKNQYGFQSDNVVLSTDDEKDPSKPFNVYATLEDYFPQLSAEEMAKAPKLTINSTLDFGRIKSESESVRQISFTNTGRKDLSIKSLQGNCRCLVVGSDKTMLKPGESGSVRIAFNPDKRSGTQTKSVVIYSNDPVAPVQRVTLSAYIE